MTPVGFEPKIPVGEWPQTYALDRVVTGTGTQSSDRPARSKSLYRLRYPAHPYLVLELKMSSERPI